ncbi:DUF3180 domain-containing protein [Cryobacterium sp. TMT1-21]|uniref:DUF3180 domain-containing protein n=1 Tax=Cryobacterium sp. TMT1-21 TaxID=1259234 RepID=UPI00106A3A5C|nr:DUF3180 domain-containing protein [Cryobacterium sp. TMT1-21]TFD12030.1 DUF3180 domain-containing protein [Cryobacterium sp. TMT1-21]
MKRTRATPVIALTMLGLVVGFLVEITSAATGAAMVLPPATLPVALVGIAIAVVALAWPIRQATRGKVRRHVNPFLAMRVAVLAKASALSGALMLGFGLGIVLYALTRSVMPAATSVWSALGMALGAAILLTLCLVSEHFCTLPPDDEDDEQGGIRA